MGDTTAPASDAHKLASRTDWMSHLIVEEGKEENISSPNGLPQSRSEYYASLVDLIESSSSQTTSKTIGKVAKGTARSLSKTISSKEYDEVEVDLNRSFGDNLQESNTSQNRQEIREILLAYAVHNRSVGYVQGMNFLCAMCLEYLGKEDAFWLLVHMTRRLPKNFYRKAGAEECLLFQKVVEKYAPDIKKYMGETYETVLNLFIFQWMLPLFVHAVHKDVNLLMWKHLYMSSDSLRSSVAQNQALISKDNNVSLKLHQMCLRILVHFGTKIIKDSAPNSHENSVTGVATEFQAGVSFVRKVLHGARDIQPTDAFPWENESLPAIDALWFAKERNNQATLVRLEESNVMHKKMSSIDFLYLDRKRLNELEMELGRYNATVLNMTQFVEAFLATAAIKQEREKCNADSSAEDITQIANNFASQLFSAVDRGEKGVVDLNELFCASIFVSTLCVEEKLHRCFNVYGKYTNEQDNRRTMEISKVHTLSIFSTLVKLAQDWYGMENSDNVFDDPKLLQRLFSWDGDTGITLNEFQQMMRVHTRLLICIEPPEKILKGSIFGNENITLGPGGRSSADVVEAESIWHFRNLINADMDFIGRCGGWERKQMQPNILTNPIKKPPRQRSNTWGDFGNSPKHRDNEKTLTPPLRPKDNPFDHGLEKVGHVLDDGTFQSAIPGNEMLKKLGKAKNIEGVGANAGRGFCSAGALDSCILA